jgi:hypothetical protein
MNFRKTEFKVNNENHLNIHIFLSKKNKIYFKIYIFRLIKRTLSCNLKVKTKLNKCKITPNENFKKTRFRNLSNLISFKKVLNKQ